jgi:hypothetical protein
LELALENLISKKMQIELEIEGITRQLRGGRRAKAPLVVPTASALKVGAARKRSRFSKMERLRRSARMKAYWENWRKQRENQK